MKKITDPDFPKDLVKHSLAFLTHVELFRVFLACPTHFKNWVPSAEMKISLKDPDTPGTHQMLNYWFNRLCLIKTDSTALPSTSMPTLQTCFSTSVVSPLHKQHSQMTLFLFSLLIGNRSITTHFLQEFKRHNQLNYANYLISYFFKEPDALSTATLISAAETLSDSSGFIKQILTANQWKPFHIALRDAHFKWDHLTLLFQTYQTHDLAENLLAFQKWFWLERAKTNSPTFTWLAQQYLNVIPNIAEQLFEAHRTNALFHLVCYYQKQKDCPNAITCLKFLLALLTQEAPDNALSIASALTSLAQCEQSLGQPEEASRHALEAQQLLFKLPPEQHKSIKIKLLKKQLAVFGLPKI